MEKTNNTAVILCAGRGTRLGDITKEVPKCLLDVHEKSILERAIVNFLNNGVNKIILVVGFKMDKIKKKVSELTDCATFIENPEYASTNTLISLWYARKYLSQGFWFLNGDVLFDFNAFSRFDNNVSQIGVIPGFCAEEEVKAKTDNESRVIALSKEVTPSEAGGEFVGLAYFNREFSQKLINCLDKCKQETNSNKQYFEVAVECAMKEYPLFTANLKDINCMEIDTVEDYQAAIEKWCER